MKNKSLKFQIVTTFILFLSISMISVSCVWVMFLQRKMVTAEIDSLKHIVSGVSAIIRNSGILSTEDTLKQLEIYLKAQDVQCYQVRNGEEGIHYSINEMCTEKSTSQKDIQIDETVARAGVIYSGSVWSVFTYSHSTIRIEETIYSERSKKNWQITIQSSLEPVYDELRQYAKVVLYYGLANILILAGIGFIRMMILVIRPIENLIDMSGGYSPGTDILFTPSSSNNEFFQLTNSLNQMVRRIHSDNLKLQKLVSELQNSNTMLEKNKKEMVRAEKLASIGKLSAGLAHEIGNPLGIIQGYVDMLGGADVSAADRQQFALRADAELHRISNLIRQLLDFSRSGNLVKQPVEVCAVLNRVLELITVQKMSQSISIVKELGFMPLRVLGDENQLQQVFLNCMLNAIEAGGATMNQEQAQIVVTAQAVSNCNDRNCVIVTIVDNGPGLGDEQLRHAFDPFYTTREPGQGTGLGLYVSYTIVESMGGTLSIDNNINGGAKVEICLPAVKEG